MQVEFDPGLPRPVAPSVLHHGEDRVKAFPVANFAQPVAHVEPDGIDGHAAAGGALQGQLEVLSLRPHRSRRPHAVQTCREKDRRGVARTERLELLQLTCATPSATSRRCSEAL